jgi:hypothetical protein
VIRPASNLNQFALLKVELKAKSSGPNSLVDVNINQKVTYLTYTLSERKALGSNFGVLFKKKLHDNHTNLFKFKG